MNDMNNLDRSSAIPLYVQLSQIIKQRILAGDWQEAGGQLPTEPELSAEFEIARGTVRQALSQLESEGIVRRERGRGTFIALRSPTIAARSAEHIGFVVPYVRDSFITTILHGVERMAADHNISVTFKHVENNPDQQTAALYDLVEQNAAGIILYPTDSAPHDSVRDLLQSRYPMVLIDRYLRGIYSDYVIADHFGGALQAVQHLLALGHERIGFVNWHDDAISMAHRAAGYRQAIIESGFSDDRLSMCEVESYPEIDDSPLYDFLQQSPAPTAIFCANDQIALAVYRMARKLGMNVPGDLALVGFGDIDLVAYLDVPLTTVAQPTYDIGQEAVRLLIQRIEQPSLDWQRLILPTRLIVRASCGAHPTRQKI